MGPNWSEAHQIEVVKRGNHKMDALAVARFTVESYEKEKNGQCRIILWKELKHRLPREFKCLPLNSTLQKTAPYGVIDQMGHALLWLIHVFAQADPALRIFLAKWDIKDGFWRLVCRAGA